VSMEEQDNGSVLLSPLHDICELKGMAKGSSFTSEKLFEYRRLERVQEDEVLESE
jgi:hypothetical protein